jgi:hypothetical protein
MGRPGGGEVGLGPTLKELRLIAHSLWGKFVPQIALMDADKTGGEVGLGPTLIDYSL